MVCDVCLISPPSRAHSRRPPLALMMLASYLEKEGFSSEIIDIKTDSFSPVEGEAEKEIIRKIIENVGKSRPSIIGLSAFCHDINENIELAKMLRENFKDSTIVFGGIQPTLTPQNFLFTGGPVDYVIMGEGEETLAELAGKIKKGEDCGKVMGIAFLKKGKVVKTECRPLIENLDELPWPAYGKIDMEYYLKPNIYAIRFFLLSAFYVFSTRGCPALCKFCANKNLWKESGKGKIIRFRSAKKIVDEIEFLSKKYGMDAIYLYDDNFLIDKKRVYEFCGELKKRKIKLIWACNARVDNITEEIVKKMRDAGCIQFDFGVESGSIKCLNSVNKNITIKQIEDAFRICRKYNMRTLANFMFNFPGETEEDVKLTHELAERIKSTEYSFAIMTPYPGTDIYDDLKLDLPREEYEVFKCSVYSEVDKRFRMAAHNLDLDKVTIDANLHFNSPFRILNPEILKEYSSQLLRSRRKMQYLGAIGKLGAYSVSSIIPRILNKNLSPYKKKDVKKSGK